MIPTLPADMEEWTEQVRHAAAGLATVLLSQHRIAEVQRRAWIGQVQQVLTEAKVCAQGFAK